MTLQREFFAGARDGFGFKMAFHPDPDKAAGALREQSLAWGSFEIWVNGQNLCSHLEEGASVGAVHWYLLPLMEWLVSNWDFLLHEERLPARNVGRDAWTSLFETAEPPPGLADETADGWEAQWQSWWSRHCLLACRDGGLFPDVLIRRWQDLIELSWGPARIAGAPQHYRFEAGQGFARLAPDDVARALYDVLFHGGQHLLEQAPDCERFRRLVEDTKAIQRADSGRRVALLAGLGTAPAEAEANWHQVESLFPRDLDRQIREAVFGQTVEGLVIRGSCQAALMYGSVSPSIDAEDSALLAGKLIALFNPAGDPADLRPYIRAEPLEKSEERAWKQGYHLAEQLLDQLPWAISEGTWVDVERVFEALGIRVEEISLHDRAIRAVAIAGPHHQPAVLINLSHEAPHAGRRRFTFAHELCHILHDRGYGASLALASGPWAPVDIEQRANAFAAMLLMPPQLLRRAVKDLGGRIDSPDIILTISQRLRTGFTATLEHLTNLNFIPELLRDQIRLDAEPRA